MVKGKAKQHRMQAKFGMDWWDTRQWVLYRTYHDGHGPVAEYVWVQ